VISTDISVRTAKWVGDVCIYTTTNRLQYLVGEQTYTITHIDSGFYLLGYIARDGRVYLADKDVNVVSYALSLSVVEYQTVVLRGDMDAAEEMLATIPADQMPKIARFLEGQGTQFIVT
jgi:coatomer subunit beta'